LANGSGFILVSERLPLTWFYLSSIMAGLRINDQKNAIAVTIIIVTAFKICISHRKNGLLNRLPTRVSFSIFD
jgi:hypothetical protein